MTTPAPATLPSFETRLQKWLKLRAPQYGVAIIDQVHFIMLDPVFKQDPTLYVKTWAKNRGQSEMLRPDDRAHWALGYALGLDDHPSFTYEV
jgi:hypothetical protein